jgi:hypothetical protein
VSYNTTDIGLNIELDEERFIGADAQPVADLFAEPFMKLLKTNSTLTSVNLEGNTRQLNAEGIAALKRNEKFGERHAFLLGAGQGFAVSLPVLIPREIGGKVISLLLKDVAGCRAAVRLTSVNKACQREAQIAAAKPTGPLPDPLLQ